MTNTKRPRWLPLKDYRMWLIGIWLLFTVTLSSWQYVFVSRLFSQLSEQRLQGVFSHYLRMVRLESASLIRALVLGGIGLFVLL